MTTRIRLLVTLLLLAVFAGASLPPAHAAPFTSLNAMLLAHYNAINLGDYATAYNLWLNPPQPYQQFVQGYADTKLVEPYFGNFQPAAPNSYTAGAVPAVLIGYHHDGVVVSFYGCFYVRYDTLAGWRIESARFFVIADRQVNKRPGPTSIAQILLTNCANITEPRQISFFEDEEQQGTQGTVLNGREARATLRAYYELINRRDYATAYTFWVYPRPDLGTGPAVDYRRPFQQFVAGYGDTAFVNLYLGNYLYNAPAMQDRPYMNGFMPAVLIGQHTDGAVVTYAGCYAMGIIQRADGTASFGIVNGKFRLIASDAPTGHTILQALNIDCLALGMGY